MESPSYKYDVAFSFLEQDEPLAVRIADLLQERARIFLYTQRQREIAGTDGEKTLNEVFGSDSRLVVVQFRRGWGNTPWTRIEETAIRNRAFDSGYGFVKLIPLEKPSDVPKWLPRTQLWVGLERWGVEGAASVIEARVQELGGSTHEESVLERAARLERSLEFENRRKYFLKSEQGVKAADEEFETLYAGLVQHTKEIRESGSRVQFSLKRSQQQIIILGHGPAVSINWRYHFANSLDDASLDVGLWEGHPPFPGALFFEEPKRLATKSLTFDLLPDKQRVWRLNGAPSRIFTTGELAVFVLKYKMEQAEARKRNDC